MTASLTLCPWCGGIISDPYDVEWCPTCDNPVTEHDLDVAAKEHEVLELLEVLVHRQDRRAEERLTDGYGREALADAFSRVQNPDDWKAPVNFVGPFTDEQIAITKSAISFFTATVAEFTDLGRGGLVEGERTLQVRATGYRMGPAGDH